MNIEKRRKQEEFILKEAKYYVNDNATLRSTGKYFGVSKSKVFRDLMQILPDLDNSLYKRCIAHMKVNHDERYSRGGQALSKKFKTI